MFKNRCKGRCGEFAVFLLKVRVKKAMFLCAMNDICAPRHYWVYLKENKVMQDMFYCTCGGKGCAPGSVTLRQDTPVSLHPLEMNHTWKSGIFSKTQPIIYMETFNLKIPVGTKKLHIKWDFIVAFTCWMLSTHTVWELVTRKAPWETQFWFSLSWTNSVL